MDDHRKEEFHDHLVRAGYNRVGLGPVTTRDPKGLKASSSSSPNHSLPEAFLKWLVGPSSRFPGHHRSLRVPKL